MNTSSPLAPPVNMVASMTFGISFFSHSLVLVRFCSRRASRCWGVSAALDFAFLVLFCSKRAYRCWGVSAALNNFIPLQFGLTRPVDFRFLGAILKTNNSGLPSLPGRLATIPSQPPTLTGAVTSKQASSSLLLAFASMVILGVEPHRDPWPYFCSRPTTSFMQLQNGSKRKHHIIIIYGPLPSNRWCIWLLLGETNS
jgi:hypothetical protein